MGVKAEKQYQFVTKSTAEGAPGRDGHIKAEESRQESVKKRLGDKLNKLAMTDEGISQALLHRDRIKKIAQISAMFHS